MPSLARELVPRLRAADAEMKLSGAADHTEIYRMLERSAGGGKK